MAQSGYVAAMPVATDADVRRRARGGGWWLNLGAAVAATALPLWAASAVGWPADRRGAGLGPMLFAALALLAAAAIWCERARSAGRLPRSAPDRPWLAAGLVVIAAIMAAGTTRAAQDANHRCWPAPTGADGATTACAPGSRPERRVGPCESHGIGADGATRWRCRLEPGD